MSMFNEFQRAALDTHEGPNTSVIETPADLDCCGDPLLRFLVDDMATSECCDSWDEALRRVDEAMSRVSEIRAAIEAGRDSSLG